MRGSMHSEVHEYDEENESKETEGLEHRIPTLDELDKSEISMDFPRRADEIPSLKKTSVQFWQPCVGNKSSSDILSFRKCTRQKCLLVV